MSGTNGLGNRYDLGTGFAPSDMSTAVTGKRLNMAGVYSVDVVIIKGAGTAAEDPTFTLQAHTAHTGGTPVNLAVIDEYYIKRETTLDNNEAWERVTQAAAATIADPGGAGTSAEQEQIVVFTVSHADLPADRPYISVNAADVGDDAQVATVLYIVHRVNKGLPTSLPKSLDTVDS